MSSHACPAPHALQVHGAIYVVDASDASRLPESKEELQKVVDHPMVVGKPLLVYVATFLVLSCCTPALALRGVTSMTHIHSHHAAPKRRSSVLGMCHSWLLLGVLANSTGGTYSRGRLGTGV